MSDLILIQTSSDDRSLLERIARQLVENRLAACVQILGPATSYFAWEGKVDTALEWICAIKTTRAAQPRVEAAISAAHNYSLPELVVLPILGGSETYLNWVRDSVTP